MLYQRIDQFQKCLAQFYLLPVKNMVKTFKIPYIRAIKTLNGGYMNWRPMPPWCGDILSTQNPTSKLWLIRLVKTFHKLETGVCRFMGLH